MSSSSFAVVSSLAKYLKDNVPALTEVLAGNNPDLDLKTPPRVMPFAIVGLIDQVQELAFIGDPSRWDNTAVQVEIYCRDYDDQITLVDKVRQAIEDATTTDSNGDIKPGMPLMGYMDKLENPMLDLMTYTSGQPGWFATPTPVVYNGGTVITSPYTVDRANGIVQFMVARLPTDDIRATYKCGFIDFDIRSVIHIPVGTEELIWKYNAVFTLQTFLHLRTMGHKIA